MRLVPLTGLLSDSRIAEMRTATLYSVIALLLAAAATSSAQSLADVARQEEARRKALTSRGKVYTAETLRTDQSAPAPAPAAAPPPAVPASGAGPAEGASGGSPPAPPATDAAKKDEAYWRDRSKGAREALDRSRTFADALQSRINGLTADFTARDDPFQRNQVAADRQKAMSELERVQKEITEQTKAIADIQEEARRAGVPAGWVR
jgi:hypothetical protein